MEKKERIDVLFERLEKAGFDRIGLGSVRLGSATIANVFRERDTGLFTAWMNTHPHTLHTHSCPIAALVGAVREAVEGAAPTTGFYGRAGRRILDALDEPEAA